MKVQREKLVNCLRAVTPGLSQREIIEQSNCFVFRKGYVITFNDDLVAVHRLGLTGLVGVVEAMPLLNILEKLTDNFVDFSTESKTEMRIKHKHGQTGLRMEPHIRLPINNIEKARKSAWHRLPRRFSEAIRLISDCASRNEARFELTCIHLHPKYVEACDGYQMMRYRLSLKLKGSVLVKQTSLQHIFDLGMTEFALSPTWIHFRNRGGLYIGCRLYREKYRELGDIMKVKGEPIVLPRITAKVVERTAIFAAPGVDDIAHLTVQLRKSRMTVIGQGVAGWHTETHNVRYGGPTIAFCIPPETLKNILKYGRSCQITPEQLKIKGERFIYVTSLDRPKEKKAKKK